MGILRKEKERGGNKVDSLKKRKGQSKNERGECEEEEKTQEERKWKARFVKDRGGNKDKSVKKRKGEGECEEEQSRNESGEFDE